MKLFALIASATAVSLRQDTLVQVDKVEEVMPHFKGYTADYSGFEGNNHNGGEWRDAYERQLPEHFTGDTADTFTQKMIRDFAIEEHDPETGKPIGQFSVTKDKTREAAHEVLATHLGMKEAAK